jgi:hypothetical protein
VNDALPQACSSPQKARGRVRITAACFARTARIFFFTHVTRQRLQRRLHHFDPNAAIQIFCKVCNKEREKMQAFFSPSKFYTARSAAASSAQRTSHRVLRAIDARAQRDINHARAQCAPARA